MSGESVSWYRRNQAKGSDPDLACDVCPLQFLKPDGEEFLVMSRAQMAKTKAKSTMTHPFANTIGKQLSSSAGTFDSDPITRSAAAKLTACRTRSIKGRRFTFPRTMIPSASPLRAHYAGDETLYPTRPRTHEEGPVRLGRKTVIL